MKKQTFVDILDEEVGIFWTGNEYYPKTILTFKEKNNIGEILCIRYSFEEQNVTYKNNIEDFLSVVFNDLLVNTYQIYLGYSAEYQSRIRSHKGILSKNENDLNSFIEVELPYKDKTVLGGIIRLSKSKYTKNINLILDNRKGFILSSNDNFFSKKQITDIIEKYRRHGNDSSINYIKLIVDYCLMGHRVYKFNNLQDGLSMDCFLLK